ESPVLPSGDPRPVTRGQVLEIAAAAADHQALVIAPHATAKKNGLFGTGVCRNSSEVAQSDLLTGFDVFGNRLADVLGNPRSEFGDVAPRWFISGDVRSFDDIGKRAVFLKLGHEPTLEGLRQAFLAPTTRIRFQESQRADWGHTKGVAFCESPEPCWPRIQTVRISGGFHDGLHLDLAPRLNSIIGGKGTGKSTLVEILRFALEGSEPTLPELAKNRAANFRANAEARITIRDSGGEEYEVVRSGEGGRAKLLKAGADTRVPVGRRLTLRVFGQRELQALSDKADALLAFVASRAGLSWQEAEREEGELAQGLKESDRLLRDLEARIAALRSLEADRADVDEQVRKAEQKGASELFKRADALAAAGSAVDDALAWPSRVTEVVESLEALLPRPQVPPHDAVPASLAQSLDGLASDITTASKSLRLSIKKSVDTLRSAEATWKRQWEADHRDVAKRLADAGVRDAKQLLEAKRKRVQLDQKLSELPLLSGRLEAAAQERRSLIDKLTSLRRKKSRSIESTVKELSSKLGKRVRLTVTPFGDRTFLENALQSALRGERVPASQIERLCEKSPEEIVSLVREGSAGLVAAGCSATTASKLTALTPDSLRAIEETSTPDKISVETDIGADGPSKWVSVDEVSPGQRATALLSLVLVAGDEPLIIDQPEDDLDNRHIYEEIVSVLAKVSERRQVIVATHNANIPVLGDAELVVALDASSESARVLEAGGLENPQVAKLARRILEGGDEAFRARHKRYLASV
ncbi:MAG: AAA family ATPase, partial [Dehalococcoidia bacterium]